MNQSDPNPFLGLISAGNEVTDGTMSSSKLPDSNNSIKAGSSNTLDVNALVEKVFNLTLDQNSPALELLETSQLIFMDEIAASISPKSTFDLETLKFALFERLLLTDPVKNLVRSKNIGSKAVNSHTIQKECITYLFECYKRMKNYPVDSSISVPVIECIVQNASTALRQATLFEPQDVHYQVMCLFESEVQENSNLVNFLNDVATVIVAEDDKVGLVDAFSPILNRIKTDFKKANIILYPRKHFDILGTFANIPYLAEVLVDYLKPARPHIPLSYVDTLLGAILNLSCLPKRAEGCYEYFEKPLEGAIKTLEGTLWSGMGELLERTHWLIERLLRVEGGKYRGDIMSWIGGCLDVNTPRGKLWSSMAMPMLPVSGVGYISDGFSINLTSLLLRLCQPFIKYHSGWVKLLKIDPTYTAQSGIEGSSVKMKSLAKESCLQPVDEGETRPISETPPSFMTEVFHMAHRALDTGLRVAADHLQTLYQELAHLQQALGESPVSSMHQTLRSTIDMQMPKVLCVRCALLEPNLLKLLREMSVATSIWLIQLVLDTDATSNRQTYAPLVERPLSFPLPPDAPPALRCVPELMLENIEVFLRLAKVYSAQTLEEGGLEALDPILSVLIVMMGSKGRVRNPHLRAKLTQCLDALLPIDETHPTLNPNPLGNFVRQVLFVNHPHADQVVECLLNVFVSIEMTGESVAFEQKFNYRRPMYVVMDYLWGLDRHKACFRNLAKLAEENMEEVDPPLFLRFLNLLMNDAVFLLDEALSNMAQLRTLHAARDAGEWERLPFDERQRNEQFFRQTGMTARFDNILGKETIHTLEYMSSDISSLLCHSTMVDRVAAMLNYFLYHLVGPKKKNFKVKDHNEYKFEPGEIVKDICKIYINLGSSDEFCSAVSRDGRSYSPQLFEYTQDVLGRIGGFDLMAGMGTMASRVAALSQQLETEEELLADAPDDFLDPIMSTVMSDPVLLPSSHITVDRSTIARHLLSDQTDPFNRAPLTMNMVIPNTELKQKISDWITNKRLNKSQSTSSETETS